MYMDYQLKGIGKELIKRVKYYYDDYLCIVIVAREQCGKFYEYSGFEKSEGTYQMFLK